MGFTRPRAEEALRQVGSNSVELSMEWLFSHPEEVMEDDEVDRALAMLLGNSGTETKEEVTTDASESIEEEQVQVPPIEELLLLCRKLLQTKDTLAFPVCDLLVMICSQNEGQERPRVLLFIIQQVKHCGNVTGSGNQNMLSAFLHVLALILNEDVAAREIASKSGLVKVASTDPEILIAALETLAALVKIIPTKLHTSRKLVGCGSVNSYLLSLAQGWGSKEEGLGLYSCITLHERTQDDGLCLFPSEVQNDYDNLQYRIGSTIYFELHGTTSTAVDSGTV